MFGKQLKKYRELKRLTQSELAIKLSNIIGKNFNGSNISSYEDGTNPKLEVITALANILDVPEQYLFDDSDNKLDKLCTNVIKQDPDKYKRKLMTNTELTRDVMKVPLLDGYVGAGSTGIIENINISEYLYVDNHSIKKAYKNKEIQALEVIGDSMSPYVDCCDIVLFTPLAAGTHLIDGKYIIQTCNGVMVKNLSFKTNGNIVISSCNPTYPPEEINLKESQEAIDILGIVVGRILKS
jgi:transcriptional regulator with XRE-family HTH domain